MSRGEATEVPPPTTRPRVPSTGGARHRSVGVGYLGLGVLLILAPIAGFLFRPGILIYQNWAWSITGRQVVPAPSVLDAYLWTNNGPDASGFTRSITDWPPFLLLSVTHDPAVLERAFFLYAYAIEFGLALIAASLFLRLISDRVAASRREGYRALLTVLFFVNPAALQWESGVAIPFLWGSTLIAIALLATLLALRAHPVRYGLGAGLALGIGATLDPRILVWGELGVVLILVTEGARLRSVLRPARVLAANAVAALPGALLTFFAYAFSGATQGSPIHSGSYAAIQAASSNAGPLNVLELMGYNISGITYASPVGAWFSGAVGQASTWGHPPFAIVDGSAVTALWLFALIAVPVAGFASLVFRTVQRETVPLGVVALTSALLAMGTAGPIAFIPVWESGLGSVHSGGVGLIAETVVGVPSWIQVLTEAALVPMTVLTFVGLTSAGRLPLAPPTSLLSEPHPIRRLAWHAHHPPRAARRAVAVVGVVLLVFASWQFFSGTFYPGGLSPGVSANEVPSTGALAPAVPPGSDLATFDRLADDPTAGAVYWPGPDTFAYGWNPRWSPPVAYSTPFVTLPAPGLAGAIAGDRPADLAPVLAADGLSAVVADNMSSEGLESAFGLGDLSTIVSTLGSAPGLSSTGTDLSGASSFALDTSPGLVSFAAGEYALNSSTGDLGIPLAALAAADRTAAIVPGSGTAAAPALSFLGPGAHLSPADGVLATPTNLSFLAPSDSLAGFPGAGSQSLLQTFRTTGDQRLDAPYGNWTVAVWSLPEGSLLLNISGGQSVRLGHAGTPLLASLNYGSSLVDGESRGIAVSPQSTVTYRVSASVVATTNSTGSVWANVVSSNDAAVNTGQASSTAVSVGTRVQNLALTGTLAPGSAVFTLRLFANFTGEVALQNVSIAWSEIDRAPLGIAGTELAVSNLTADVPTPLAAFPVDVWAQVGGPGLLEVSSSAGSSTLVVPPGPASWRELSSVPVASGLSLRMTGNLTVDAVALLPSTAAPTPSASVSGLAVGADFSVHGNYRASSPGWLVLYEPPSTEWRLSIDGDAGESGTDGGLNGMIFSAPAGNHSFVFELPGLTTQPVLLVVVGALYVVLGVAVWRPPPLAKAILRRWMQSRSSP